MIKGTAVARGNALCPPLEWTDYLLSRWPEDLKQDLPGLSFPDGGRGWFQSFCHSFQYQEFSIMHGIYRLTA